jgi:hypothetical protein
MGGEFHQLHRRGRVEEMQREDAVGVLEACRDGMDRQRGGVAGKDRIGGDQGLQRGEEGLLGLQLLDDGLDDEAAGGEGGKVLGHGQAGEGGVAVGLGEFPGGDAGLQGWASRSRALSRAG